MFRDFGDLLNYQGINTMSAFKRVELYSSCLSETAASEKARITRAKNWRRSGGIVSIHNRHLSPANSFRRSSLEWVSYTHLGDFFVFN